MAIVAVVQVAIVNVVDVVTVGDGYVAAALAVDVVVTFVDGVLCVASAVAAFVPVAVVIVVQVAVVDVVDVVAVFNCGMAAALAVNVLVVGMGMAVAHFVSFHQDVFTDGAMIVETDIDCK